MTSNQGPPGAAACWDWSQNAFGETFWEENLLFSFFPCSTVRLRPVCWQRGQREVSVGWKKKPFWGLSRGPVSACVHVGEYKWASSRGMAAVPIISSWENPRRKIETEEEQRRWKKIKFSLFVPTDSSLSEASCRSSLLETAEGSLVLLLWWKEMIHWHTEVSSSNTTIPSSTKAAGLWLPAALRRRRDKTLKCYFLQGLSWRPAVPVVW